MEAYFREHVKAASQIVLSSEDARRDFARVFPDRVGATHVVRFCSVPDAQWWEQDPAGVARRHGLPERFLIVCNQFTRHKNHLVLVEAMKLLRDRGTCDVHLACTGSTFDHRQEDYVGQVRAFVERHGLHDRVHILGLLPRAEQVALMRRSVAVAQPSSFEGWSTIIEDAKTLGKRVFASELPVHAEQLGVAHELLPLDDPAAWAESIERAWPDLTPGPHTQDEADAMSSLAQAQDQCAQAFIRALLAGAHG
jgi:glycosyltransferase involved in cell wall biosynthesis